MVAWQTDRGTLSSLSERANFEHGNVRLRLSVRLRVRLRREHKADFLGLPVPETEGIPLNSEQVPKFRELQVPNFQAPRTSSFEIQKKKLTKNCFFLFQQKNILDTAFCLFTHYSIAKLRARMELNVVF